MCALILLDPLDVESILRIIRAWCWPVLSFSHLAFVNDAATRLGCENIFTTAFMKFNRLGGVLSYTWSFLFEVNVDCDGLDVVERIILVEWKTEISFMLHVWRCKMFLRQLRVIGTRTNYYSWV